MAGVVVLVLHAEAGPDAGPIERWVTAAREQLARSHGDRFHAAGAPDVRIQSGPPDDTPFGARLRDFVERERPDGIVVLGSGSVPLATVAERGAFIAAADDPNPRALANNRYSADITAVSHADVLRRLPDLPADNALPRWLEERAGRPVGELRGWRLGVDVDGPLDLVLVGLVGRRRRPADAVTDPPPEIDIHRVQAVLDRIATVAADPRAELTIAGRTSARDLGWLERSRPARVRALVEERGLRAAAVAALGGDRPAALRPPASVLGALIDRDGPGSLGKHLERLGEAAVIDSRVLLAHRLGADEGGWPSAEDRFASDLLLHERIDDPWLRELTRAAAEASIPIALGGHTLVGPGLRLALGRPIVARRDG